MTTLDDIALKAQALADQRQRMGQLVTSLNEAMRALLQDRMPAVRAAIDDAQQAWTALEAELKANPQLFVKPRKVTFSGIVVGYQKGKGGLEIGHPLRTVELIERHFPDRADVLIDVKKVPAKGALAQLSAADLKRIAVQVKDTGDEVVIRPEDGAIDKLVRSLVKSAIDEAQEASAED